MNQRDLSMGLIRIDGDTQSRAAINEQVVKEYTELWESGVELDPIDVFFDGRQHWLADGFHRYLSRKHAGHEVIKVTVHEGTQQDAILFSAAANQSHGLRRTNADKRQAVLMVLGLHDDWSDRAIAEHCGVGHQLVGTVRQETCPEYHVDDSSTCESREDSKPASKRKRVSGKRKGRDGKEYSAPKRKSSKRKAKTDQEAKEEAIMSSPAFDERKGTEILSRLRWWLDERGKKFPDTKPYHKKAIATFKTLVAEIEDWQKNTGGRVVSR